MAEGGGGGGVRMRDWTGVWSFLARDEWLLVLWLTLAWTVFLRRVWGEVRGWWYTGRVRGGMWTEVLNAACECEKGLMGSEGCAQSIGSQRRGFELTQSCAWWTALSRCFTRYSRARPSMALCSARVETGIG